MNGAATTRSDALGKGPRYLIRDLDKKICDTLFAVAGSIKEVETPYRTPQADGDLRKVHGQSAKEYMDHILIHADKHLERVVTEYTAYFNQKRPHRGIDQRIPDQYELPRSKPTSGCIISKAILGGLHYSYSRTAYLN